MTKSRNLLLPEELTNSRVYLADFDRITYSQVAWNEDDVKQLVANYHRKVKFLLLVKGHMVIPVTHLLESELAREVIGNNPELFSSKAVIPMLPQDFNSAAVLLQTQIDDPNKDIERLYEGSEQRDMAVLMDETAQYVRWKNRNSSEWFRRRILADARDDQSLLNLTFRHNKLRLPKKTYRHLVRLGAFDRSDVYFAGKALGDLGRWELLSSYADFVYYLSDALAVQSEGILPQENLLDFSLSDLAEGKTRFSEYEVFTKLFIDMVKTMTSSYFPADFLDALSIQDALELHGIAMQGKFIEKYNAIQQTTKDSLAIHDPERLVLTLTELETYERELHSQFESALQRELPSHVRERRLWSVTELLHTIATLVIPFYGNVDAGRELLVSGLSILGKDDIARRITKRVTASLEAVDRVVDRRSISDQPILLDFVKKIKHRYIEYL